MSRTGKSIRFWILLLFAAEFAGGCASFKKQTEPELPPPTPQQQAWWDANRHNARYEPGRGYAVQGAQGYYDDQGRPLVAKANVPEVESVEYDDKTGLQRVSDNSSKWFKKLIGRGPNERVAKDAMAQADSLFREGKYREAAKKYKVAYDRWPDSPQEEEALYKCAESYFFCDRYSKANDNYGMFVKKYPNTMYLDQLVARRFKIARYWEQLQETNHQYALVPNLFDKTRPIFDTTGHAMKIYDRVHLDDPTGPLADDALMATANAHFINNRYNDAAYYYKLLREEYPKSEHQYHAHLFGLRSHIMSYQGPDYMADPLEQADELAVQLLTQFPNEVGDEKQRIIETRAEILAQKTQREYELANYYHRNKYYGASRMYYNNVIKMSPETELAKTSKAHIEEVSDKPDLPTPPFEWLVKWLPDSNSGLGTGAANSGLPAGMPNTPGGVGSMGGMAGAPSGVMR
jgi:outer membrane protein assembly factor BamD (BamD/ComL family)